MECQVLAIREVGKGLRIAHVAAGGLFGDVPAAEEIKERGPGWLRVKLVVRVPAFASMLRVASIPRNNAGCEIRRQVSA